MQCVSCDNSGLNSITEEPLNPAPPYCTPYSDDSNISGTCDGSCKPGEFRRIHNGQCCCIAAKPVPIDE